MHVIVSQKSDLPACMNLHNLASDDSVFNCCLLKISIPNDDKLGKWNPPVYPLICWHKVTSPPPEMEKSLVFKMLPALAFDLFLIVQQWFTFICCQDFVFIEGEFFFFFLNVVTNLLLSRMFFIHIQNALCKQEAAVFAFPLKAYCIWCGVCKVVEDNQSAHRKLTKPCTMDMM